MVAVQLHAFLGVELVGGELAVQRAVNPVVHNGATPVGKRLGSAMRRVVGGGSHIGGESKLRAPRQAAPAGVTGVDASAGGQRRQT
jgi:hypothetical protein